MCRWSRLKSLPAVVFMLLMSATVSAQDLLNVTVTYLSRYEEPVVPLSLLDLVVEDNGRLGARLAIADNKTTGSFLGHEYILDEVIVGAEESIAERVADLVTQGRQIFVADLKKDDLLQAADAAPDALVFNVRAQDDSLRSEDCRANMLHIIPSRNMRTDALAQYLSWKRWNKLVLVTGRYPEDAAFAEAVKRSAKRYQLKIVEEKPWTSKPGARRTDSGHHSLQQEVPSFSQFKKHDVVIVADEADEFGEYLPYRMAGPGLVAGTQGLVPTSWHRSQEQWGATQIQRRFQKLAGRVMEERDYAAWAAVRVIGEGVSLTSSNQADVIESFVLSDKFKLAGFKGVPLTFRDWNGQLRQPILVVGPRMLVTVSPQDGFLHQRSELDTMGLDKPDSACDKFDHLSKD